jgi:hypothetical protein
MHSRVFVVGACLLVAGILSGCTSSAISPNIQTGRADVNETGDGGSITTSDWTYGLPTEGVSWVDRQGSLHDRGRPECLAPGTSTQIRFAAVNVEVDGVTWRPVVWLSCQLP